MDVRRISARLTNSQKLDVVSVEQVKAHARIVHDTEDELISGLIVAAYDFLSGPEGWLNRCALLAEKYEAYVPVFGSGIHLPMRPYYEKTGDPLTFDRYDGTVYQPVDSALYYTMSGHDDAFPQLLRVDTTTYWSTDASYARNLRIRFWAGFGTADEIPSGIKLAICMLASHWYANREVSGPDGRTVGDDIKWGLKSLCGRYRIALDHT